MSFNPLNVTFIQLHRIFDFSENISTDLLNQENTWLSFISIILILRISTPIRTNYVAFIQILNLRTVFMLLGYSYLV